LKHCAWNLAPQMCITKERNNTLTAYHDNSFAAGAVSVKTANSVRTLLGQSQYILLYIPTQMQTNKIKFRRPTCSVKYTRILSYHKLIGRLDIVLCGEGLTIHFKLSEIVNCPLSRAPRGCSVATSLFNLLLTLTNL